MALSGGMDSTSLLLRLLRDGHRVTCISYLYGQKHVIEIERSKENIGRLQSLGFEVEQKIIDLTSAMGSFHSALTNDEPACCILYILTQESTEAIISFSVHPEPADVPDSSGMRPPIH